MSRTLWKSLFIMWIVVISLLLAALPVMAETPLGGGPDNPASPAEDWVELPEDAWHFYGFRDEGDITDVLVTMKVVPHHGADYEIWSKAEVQKWADEIEFDPIGMGSTACDCDPDATIGKFVWLGTFTKGDIYYVVVKHKGDVPSNYKLTIEGEKVSHPFDPFAPVVAEEAEAADMVEPAAAPEPEPEMAMGMTPDTAMEPNSEWTELPAGTEHWYKFNYFADRGPEHDEDPPLVDVVMYMKKPVDNARFDVWTQAEVEQLIKEGEDILGEDTEKGTCVGCGTDNEDLKGDYSWSGSFMESGTYYVRVQHTPCRCQPAYYQLQIFGDSVSY
jgi:hypothetical protein